MPINIYTGLMRSGKSYEVVSMVILPAVLGGRDVVTNIDGINEQLIHDYLALKNPSADRSKFGHIRHVTNEDVFKPDFLPFYDDAKAAHTDTVVQPGDLVCIDEAWRFWGTDCKLLKQHKSFFLEHGHFTHADSGVACDLVCMIQDMGTLHRFVRNVVAFSYRTHKKVSLGMSNTYSVTQWEGSKLQKATQTGNWVRRYNKEIFPLYSSFKGGADGKLVNADKRQNVFTNVWLWVKIVGALAVVFLSGWKVFAFFNPPSSKPETSKASSSSPVASGSPSPVSSSLPPASSWRIAGELVLGDQRSVLLVDSSGRVRLESPSNFTHLGLEKVGRVDGEQVTTYTGSASRSFLGGKESK